MTNAPSNDLSTINSSPALVKKLSIVTQNPIKKINSEKPRKVITTIENRRFPCLS